MKKLWNSILATLLMAACMLICFAQLSNTLIQKDLGTIVIQEVDLNGKMNALFQSVETILPSESAEKLENLKEGMKKSDKVQGILQEAGRHMLEDIVNGDKVKQDINDVIKEMIYGYNDQFAENMKQMGLDTYIDKILHNMETQSSYNAVVLSFQQSIPEPYQKLMMFVSTFSNPIATTSCIISAVVLLGILIILNWKHLAWTFSVGLSGVISGALLLIVAQIVPRIFERMVMRIGHVMSLLEQVDFHSIIVYGLTYFIVGVVCLLIYGIYTKNKLD